MSVARPKSPKGGGHRPHAKPAAKPAAQNRPLPDRTSPLVLDVRELGRSPGAMLALHREVPAPADLGTPMVGVPEGAAMLLDGRLESVVEGILATFTVTAPLAGECGRCLEPFTTSADVDVQELYYFPDRLEDLGEDDDEETLVVDADLLDLEPPIRDAVVLALPMNPLCRPDCEGVGYDSGDSGPDDEDEPAPDAPVDDRWAALKALSQD